MADYVVKITVSIHEGQSDTIRALARKNKVSISEMIRRCIDAYDKAESDEVK